VIQSPKKSFFFFFAKVMKRSSKAKKGLYLEENHYLGNQLLLTLEI
jgi:hypothetical protein